MKKVLVILLVLAVGVIGTLAVQKYLLKTPGPGVQKIATAEGNSFDRVTRNLDPGGTFYMYLSTEKTIETAEKLIEGIKEMALGEAKEPAKKKWVEQIANVVTMLLNDSGLFEISGIGVSSVPMKNGFNHGRVVVHHYKDKGDGLMWNLWEDGPHALDSQNLLPANTVFAGFSDCGLNYFWEWLNKEAAKAGIPEVQKGLEQLKPMLQSKGLDLDGILGSLGGKWGFIVTFDEDKKGKLPLMGQTIEIPDPAFALVLYVKDETIFNVLQKLSKAPPKVEGNVKKIVGPQIPGSPITLEPMVVQKDNLLIFASNGKVVDEIFAGQGGDKGLLASEEFKSLSANMPEKGNGYTFLSSKIIKTAFDIRKKVVEMSGEEAKEKFAAFERLELFPEDLALYNVMQNTDEGFIFTSNNNMPVGSGALLPALVVGGIVAAIAIPNLVAAKKKGGLKATMGDMKTIGTAVESYKIDNGYAPQAESLVELKKLLEPFYIRRLPLVDGWGFDFHYTHGTGEQQDTYSVGSGGKDGLFEGFDQAGFYEMTGPGDFVRDIIFSNSMFVYGPRIK
ncbi:MAG: type II secretion system protein GspG [Candidatus Aminicenantes bacterium]|nr:type II secretion system protein GspG [Candidatus Aminicenantes bacterium]